MVRIHLPPAKSLLRTCGYVDPCRRDGLFAVAVDNCQSWLKLLNAPSQNHLQIAKPGFVQVEDDGRTLLIPDRRGNNRIDSIKNVVEDPRVALIFLVPGANETYRVNGRARVSVDPVLKRRFAVDGKEPTTVIVVAVEQTFQHCPKALVRSDLWKAGKGDRPKGVPTETSPRRGHPAPTAPRMTPTTPVACRMNFTDDSSVIGTRLAQQQKRQPQLSNRGGQDGVEPSPPPQIRSSSVDATTI